MISTNSDAAQSRIRQSVCRWCYPDLTLDELCLAAIEIGIESVELLMPHELQVPEKYGLACAMVSFPTGFTPTGVEIGLIERAFNRLEYHDTLLEIYEPHLKAAAAGGAKQVICFSGNRDGMSDEQGLENCEIGLKRLLPLAEKLGIILSMELLNSKIDHQDYMCDHTAWGAELCRRIASENFKLLYDIYHMQMMEGDVIHTIRTNHDCISHYHTGGVPGRGEIDGTQELHYPAIIRAIAETGYQGFVGQEFIAKNPDKLAALRQGVEICTL